MTTPTTITTSMIPTATTIMTDVVVVPSRGGGVGCVVLTGTVSVVVTVSSLLVGCVLLMTGALSVVVTVPSLLVGCVLLMTGAVSVLVTVSSLLVGCVLLMTGAVSVLVTVSSLLVGCVLLMTRKVSVGITSSTVWEGVASSVVGSSAVESSCTTWHVTWKQTQGTHIILGHILDVPRLRIRLDRP